MTIVAERTDALVSPDLKRLLVSQTVPPRKLMSPQRIVKHLFDCIPIPAFKGLPNLLLHVLGQRRFFCRETVW